MPVVQARNRRRRRRSIAAAGLLVDAAAAAAVHHSTPSLARLFIVLHGILIRRHASAAQETVRQESRAQGLEGHGRGVLLRIDQRDFSPLRVSVMFCFSFVAYTSTSDNPDGVHQMLFVEDYSR